MNYALGFRDSFLFLLSFVGLFLFIQWWSSSWTWSTGGFTPRLARPLYLIELKALMIDPLTLRMPTSQTVSLDRLKIKSTRARFEDARCRDAFYTGIKIWQRKASKEVKVITVVKNIMEGCMELLYLWQQISRAPSPESDGSLGSVLVNHQEQ